MGHIVVDCFSDLQVGLNVPDTNKRICFLNISADEVIRSLFYNKNNDSLITVSVYASDNFSSLKCRTTPIEYIRRGQPDAGFPLFESESLRWPGFVEFDDVNGKVLTYSAQDRCCPLSHHCLPGYACCSFELRFFIYQVKSFLWQCIC
jgi:hypothetical protein